MPAEPTTEPVEPPAPTEALPALGSAEHRALVAVTTSAYARLGVELAALPEPVATELLSSVWRAHGDRIRAAYAHHISL